MKKPTRRVEKMLIAQTVSSILVTLGAIFSSIYITMQYFGMSPLAMIGAGLAALAISKAGHKTVVLVTHQVFYGDDREALIREGAEAQEYFKSQIASLHKRVGGPIIVDTKIIATSPKIGTYQDAPMYDWIEVTGANGQPFRFAYHGTIDLRKKTGKNGVEIQAVIPEDCVMVPPGLLYQVVVPINTTA